MNGSRTALEVKNNSKTDSSLLITDADAFIEALPYEDYILYSALALDTNVQPYAGAGKLNLTILQWEKASYNDVYTAEDPEPIPPIDINALSSGS